MVIQVSQGPKGVVFSYPTNWCLASWRGQYGNQSLDGQVLGPNLIKKGLEIDGATDVSWELGQKVYSIGDSSLGAQIFDRFVTDPGCIWTELERILETLK
jgi:hypothetical protein